MAVDYLITQYVSRGSRELEGDLNRLSRGFNAVETAAMRSQRIGTAWAAAGAMGTAMMVNLTRRSLQASGEVARVETGYRTVLRNEKEVRKLSKGVRDFDIESPFSYLDSARGSQMLLASGFRADLLPTMYAVGNATVAAGKGTDTFVRALAIMGKIKTSGVLSGVRVNQFAAAGINVKDILKKQLGLTDEQMINIGRLKLKADVVIPALIKGLNEQFKGGLKLAASQYLGALETLEGSQDKLKASIGKSIEKDATRGVKSLIKLTEATSKWTSQHPRLTRMGLAFGFVGTLAATFFGLRKAIAATRLITAALTAATTKDIAVERIKTGVATKEAIARNAAAAATGRQVIATRALGASNLIGAAPMAALGASSAARGLPMLPPVGGMSALGAGATGAAGAGFFARMGAFFARPLLPTSVLLRLPPNLALSGVGQGLWTASLGTALRGAVLGAIAGIGVRNDLKALGASDAKANVIGAGVGLSAAVLAAFNPPAAALIAGALAIRLAANRLYIKPLERAAIQGTGAENADLYGKDLKARADAAQKAGGGDSTFDPAALRQKAEIYSEMSSKAGIAGDEESRDLFNRQAAMFRRRARNAETPGTNEYDERNRRDILAAQARLENSLGTGSNRNTAEGARRRAIERARQAKAAEEYQRGAQSSIDQREMRVNDVSQSQTRNGKREVVVKVTLDEAAGNQIKRELRYNTLTPAPAY